MSIEKANELNERYGNLPIPPYLQDAHYSHAKDLGHGIGYEYAHIYEGHYSGQPNLPEAIRGEELYQPSENGYEQRIRAHMSGLTGKVKYARPEDLMPRDEH